MSPLFPKLAVAGRGLRQEGCRFLVRHSLLCRLAVLVLGGLVELVLFRPLGPVLPLWVHVALITVVLPVAAGACVLALERWHAEEAVRLRVMSLHQQVYRYGCVLHQPAP